tara:strand:- start:94 stop:306 length:213 start_codon:yes stop_codon:yes gene_type:complete
MINLNQLIIGFTQRPLGTQDPILIKYTCEGIKNISNTIIPHAPIFRYLGNSRNKERAISINPHNILMPYG